MAVSYSECHYFVADNGVTLGAMSRNRIIADASVKVPMGGVYPEDPKMQVIF